MQRVVIFAESMAWEPAILVRSALAALQARPDVELAGVCVPRPQPFRALLRNHLLFRVRTLLQVLLDGTRLEGRAVAMPIDLGRLARRFDAAVLTPPRGDANAPDFIARLRKDIRPSLALSFYFPQRFSADLLSVFRHAVNYHNGLLPAYRGLHATAWSVYHGRRKTGYSFHRMTPAFDEGPVLMQGTVDVGSDRSTSDLDLEKAVAASARIPRLLEMVLDGAPGTAQRGEGGYFSYQDYRAATAIPEPSLLSSAELQRRLRAFGRLRVRIGCRWYDITRVRRVEGTFRSGGRFSFRTADGATIDPVRFRYLPYAAYRLYVSARRPAFRGAETRSPH